MNLAILSRSRASEVHIARSAFFGTNAPSSRPALGITLSNTLFFSVHALSPGGNDGRQLLQNISAIARGRSWAALGDWNRLPANLAIPAHTFRITAGTATHNSGHELDYMVTNELIPGMRGVTRQMSSDHAAVEFSLLAERQPIELLNPNGGWRHLTVSQNSNGAFVINGMPNNSANSRWNIRSIPGQTGLYNVVNNATGRCWRSLSGYLVIWDCNGGADEKFAVNHFDDTGQLLFAPGGTLNCVETTPNSGYGAKLTTTASCSSNMARWNFRFDNEADRALVSCSTRATLPGLGQDHESAFHTGTIGPAQVAATPAGRHLLMPVQAAAEAIPKPPSSGPSSPLPAGPAVETCEQFPQLRFVVAAAACRTPYGRRPA